jgi:hypothetical protein
MRRRILLASALIVMITPVAFTDGLKELKTRLIGFEEVPSISTEGGGEFRGRISRDESEITFELSYEQLTGNVLQSHIHFGQEGVNGNIVVFLCTNLNNGPAGTQPCPPPPATITGTLRATDMVNLAAGQGIAAGDFAELVRAIRAGKAYVNVHSSVFPGGEIRVQLDRGKEHEHDDDDH